MQKIFASLCIFTAIVACESSYAQPQSPSLTIDELFKTVDLKNLNHTDTAVNFIAQLSDPTASTANMDDFVDFYAISTIFPENQTIITSFDAGQTKLKQRKINQPWLGVSQFSQSEIPAITLQTGLSNLQTCMASQGEPVPQKIARIAIYKTIFSGEIIYDYVAKNDYLPDGLCLEELYSTHTNQCELGMVVNCHFDMMQLDQNHLPSQKAR